MAAGPEAGLRSAATFIRALRAPRNGALLTDRCNRDVAVGWAARRGCRRAEEQAIECVARWRQR